MKKYNIYFKNKIKFDGVHCRVYDEENEQAARDTFNKKFEDTGLVICRIDEVNNLTLSNKQNKQ